MRQGKKGYTRVEQRVLQLLCVLLLLSFLGLMLMVELRRNDQAIGRERASAVSFTYVDDLAGYVFRDETTVTDGGRNGALHYLVKSGDPVQKDQPVLEAYEIGREQNERERAAALYSEIDRLQRALSCEDGWQQIYLEQYFAMMQSAGGSDWQGEVDAAERFLPALQQGGVASGGAADAVRARIAALEAEVESLVKHAGAPKAVCAITGGYFSREVDGYEAYFRLDETVNGALTPSRLQYLLGKNNVPERTVGKVVDGEGFCLAVPVTSQQAQSYSAGQSYHVRMTRGGEADAVLTHISTEGDAALLVFSFDHMPEGMDLARRQPVQILRNTVSGISVPDSALCFEGDRAFVYVLEGGAAARREIELLCREGGCCILAAKESEGYLRVGEPVLLFAQARGVFEGMVLKQ